MITKFQTDVFHQYAIQKYGIGGFVLKENLIDDIQQELNVDSDRANTLLTLMVGVKYFKEEKEKLYVSGNNGEYFDNSIIKYRLKK